MHNNYDKKSKLALLKSLRLEYKGENRIKYKSHSQKDISYLDSKILDDHLTELADFEELIIKPLVQKSNILFNMELTFSKIGELNYDEIRITFGGEHQKKHHYVNVFVKEIHPFMDSIESIDIYFGEGISYNLYANVLTDSENIEEYIERQHPTTNLKMEAEIRSFLGASKNEFEKVRIPVSNGRLNIRNAEIHYSYNANVTEIGKGRLACLKRSGSLVQRVTNE